MPRIGTTGYVAALAEAGFPVPVLPALRPEVVVVPLAAGVALDHGNAPLVVRNAAARALIPLLDGTRDVSELSSATGLPHAAVNQILGLLAGRSMVQDGPVPADPDVDAVRYVSRGTAAIGAHDRADQSSRVLADTSVVVLGDAEWAGKVRTGFSDRGLRPREATSSLTLVCVSAESDHGMITEPDGDVLPVQWADGQLVCGPYLEPSSCAECALAGIADLAPQPRPGPERAGELVDAVALLTCDVLHTVGRFGHGLGGSLVLRHDVRRWSTTRHDVVARPLCPRCTVEPLADPPASLALVTAYEAAVSLPPQRWYAPAVQRSHYEPGNIAAQQRFSRAGQAAVQNNVVREMLRHTAGLRVPFVPGEAPDRFAPSPGNLGAVTAYWVGERGSYQYDPLRDELIVLPGQAAIDAVVLTADLTKLYPKYGGKSYRLAWLEAGAAVANLATYAHHAGFGVRVPGQWGDEEWSAIIGADGRGELLCAVVLVSGVPDS
jgi:hypothetical protein